MSTSDLSQDMYRRIYRLGQKGVESRIIAAALKLPPRTVQGVLDRLFSAQEGKKRGVAPMPMVGDPESEAVLSIFIFSKVRYNVMDLGGRIEGEGARALRDELQKQLDSPVKAVALRLYDVTALDSQGAEVLTWARAAFTAKGRFIGVLDPSAAVEKELVRFGLEERYQIFGTEIAFEDAAFERKSGKR